jgi:hypothetical protein
VDTAADERTRASAGVVDGGEPTRPTPAVRPKHPKLGRLRRFAVVMLLVWAGVQGCRLGGVMADARDLRGDLPSRGAEDLDEVWTAWESLESRSVMGMGPGMARDPLVEWLLAQSAPLIEDYRSDRPTIREGGWRRAGDLLERAQRLRPRDREIRAQLEYCRGHLDRIAGHDLRRTRRAQGDARLNEAVSRFRRAASLHPKWADPHLGLGRVYLQEFDDLDQGEAAFARARELGARLGTRDVEMLADAYLRQSARDQERAAELVGEAEEEALLRQVRDHADQAVQHYDQLARRGGTTAVRARAQTARTRREHARLRLEELAQPGFWR